MKIVVDDFGLSPHANHVVIKAIDQNILWGASVLVNLPSSQAALTYINQNKKACRFGLHLNLTDGRPVSKPANVSTLVDNQGNFLGWTRLIKTSLEQKIDLGQVELETKAQLAKLEAVTKPVKFFNSLHHIHLWPKFARIIRPIIAEAKIHYVRSPHKILWLAMPRAHWSKAFTIQSVGRLKTYQTNSLATWLVDIDWAGPSDQAREKLVQNLPPDTELICHPVFDFESQLQNITSVQPKGESTLEWLTKEQGHKFNF